MEGEKKRYTRQRAKKEKRLLPCSLRRSPSAMTVFMLPSFARSRYTGCSGRKRREERRREREESREDVEGERERREENGEVLRFFWMSQARVRRRGKDEQEAEQRRGSGRKRRRKRKKHREIA